MAPLALTLALALTAGACRDSEEAPDESGSAAAPSTSAPAEPAVETKVSFGELTGRLPRPERARVENQIVGVVDGWTEAAYLGGDYPRTDFADSWPGFTRGAQALATRDQALMSNQDIGDRIDGVELSSSRVVLDVLSVKKRAVGVTARVRLGFRTTGEVERTIQVQGRLYLTHNDGGWQVFGYDISKGAA